MFTEISNSLERFQFPDRTDERKATTVYRGKKFGLESLSTMHNVFLGLIPWY